MRLRSPLLMSRCRLFPVRKSRRPRRTRPGRAGGRALSRAKWGHPRAALPLGWRWLFTGASGILLYYRDRDALLLFLSALLPQRWFFDSFILWLIPQKRREIVWTVFFSWGAGVWRWYHIPHSFTEVGRWTVLLFYLPMLAVVLLRKALPRKEKA